MISKTFRSQNKEEITDSFYKDDSRDPEDILKYLNRKRSHSMFASFQNMIKRDEDTIKLLLPLEKDHDLNLPIADAVLEIQLEYMDKLRKEDFKKFMRRKSWYWSFWGHTKQHRGEFIIFEEDAGNFLFFICLNNK